MSKWFEITPNKIAAFALLSVAISSAFVMYMQWRLTDILSAPDWCARAINAEKLAEPREQSALDTCTELLFKQVGSLAVNSHIYAGIIALCLLVLMVIVVAGGRLKFRASKDDVEFDMARHDAAAAAQQTADAAVREAEEIADDRPVN